MPSPKSATRPPISTAPADPEPDSNPAIADAEGAAAVNAEADLNKLVSIFNKNPPGGDFVHHVYEPVYNEDNKVVRKKVKTEWRIGGRQFANVPRWIATLWMKQNPGSIVSGESVSKGASAPPASNERVQALEGENSELKTRVANMEKMLADLKEAQLKNEK